MAARDTTRLYRSVVREVAKASISPRAQRNRDISASLRQALERHAQRSARGVFRRDVEDVATFMRSQRVYKTLLERYNPVMDLTGEERAAATARRVGLNMPKVD